MLDAVTPNCLEILPEVAPNARHARSRFNHDTPLFKSPINYRTVVGDSQYNSLLWEGTVKVKRREISNCQELEIRVGKMAQPPFYKLTRYFDWYQLNILKNIQPF